MNRIFIFALDGTPYSLLNKLITENQMPYLERLIKEAQFKQMDSVIPPVSSVAWASFMTGNHPGNHGIFGFVEREPKTMKWYVPLSDQIKMKTIQANLSSLYAEANPNALKEGYLGSLKEGKFYEPK